MIKVRALGFQLQQGDHPQRLAALIDKIGRPHQQSRVLQPDLPIFCDVLLDLPVQLLPLLPGQGRHPLPDYLRLIDLGPGLPGKPVKNREVEDQPLDLLLVHGPPIVVVEVIAIKGVGVLQKELQTGPLAVVGPLVIGPVDGGGIKADGVVPPGLHIPHTVLGAVGHRLRVGDVQEGGQRGKGSPRVQLPVLKADHHAVPVQPVIRVAHKAAVAGALGDGVGHNVPRRGLRVLPILPLGAVVHRADRRPIAGGKAAHRRKGLDVLKAKHGCLMDPLQLLAHQHHLVAPPGLEGVVNIAEMGLEEDSRCNPRGGVQRFGALLLAQKPGH